MKFENLKVINTYPQKPIKRYKYWTKANCTLLADNFYILGNIKLRQLFEGRSLSTLKSKAYQLQKHGWIFTTIAQENS